MYIQERYGYYYPNYTSTNTYTQGLGQPQNQTTFTNTYFGQYQFYDQESEYKKIEKQYKEYLEKQKFAPIIVEPKKVEKGFWDV